MTSSCSSTPRGELIRLAYSVRAVSTIGWSPLSLRTCRGTRQSKRSRRHASPAVFLVNRLLPTYATGAMPRVSRTRSAYRGARMAVPDATGLTSGTWTVECRGKRLSCSDRTRRRASHAVGRATLCVFAFHPFGSGGEPSKLLISDPDRTDCLTVQSDRFSTLLKPSAGMA
jgi:hypothetical protein